MTLVAAHPSTSGVPFARDLALHGDRPALITDAGVLTYRDLARLVTERATRLGTRRRLVMVTGANRVHALVNYLAALSAGHPVLLAPGDSPTAFEALRAAYDPDVVAGETVHEVRATSAHELHPDLALLLSTSGSTGSPKLVRLSQENLQANAESIGAYLGLTADDRAATNLPMHYCYGLSVINSHLLRGASLLLTELSVVEPDFWRLFAAHSATSFAGVPYTFELLDRVGFDRMTLPSLRYVTQAGGRLDPQRVRHFAALGRRAGWELFVMYGQTEATARMAYLPPELAEHSPHTIGVPVPGGSLHLSPAGDDPDGVGELVYRGPNVMLGYAESPADLALGRTVHELRTGDLARRTPGGLFEIVGRRSRFTKIFGLRLDLQQIEARLRQSGITAGCAGDDDILAIAYEGGHSPEHVRHLVAEAHGLPARVIHTAAVAELPRLASGKPDYQAVRALATPPDDTPAPALRSDVHRTFARVLGHQDVRDTDTFVSLGGDSLSYVDMSIKLEQLLGRLPERWHTTPVGELAAVAEHTATAADPVPARRRVRVDTTVALRAIAIVLIVGSHIQVFDLPGGAHVLIGVAGFNFARFHLTTAERRERVRHLARSTARIVLGAVTWIGAMYLLTDDYEPASVFLLGYLFAPEHADNYWWHFWFVEALVYYLLILLAALCLPAFDRLERRRPFALPLALASVGLIARYQLVPGVELPTPVVVFWLFALGWAIARAERTWQRVAVSAAVVATVPGLFADAGREAVIVAGLLVLVWITDLPSLPLLNRVAALLATSSMYIYLTHWQIFRPIDDTSRPLALLASLVFGIGYALTVPRAAARLHKLWRRPATAPAVQRSAA
ncbi:AMP-dependent synthetase [Catellatospora sp. IY07-71]|uniref:AMP-binding protein n=1 Tax=Catellatospora sp. IY07-71 TaxID=2728827 RepID=UPI001BB3231F|nr:AMP-binding protein [Catellatospora sp. IY07-71]BCJ76821.1 AMP-dependent synthetase [Catellatospora sp. IY07-71]